MSKTKTPRIYLRSYKRRIEWDSDACTEMNRNSDAIRKKRQRHGECNCDKADGLYCDGVCEDCEHYFPDYESLSSIDEDGNILADTIPDYNTLEEQYELNDQRRRLYAAIPKLKDNVDVQIINLYLQDYTVREIAKALNFSSPNAVEYRIKKSIEELKVII